MLRPTKHSHPDQTVMFISTKVLSLLKKKRLQEYDELRDFCKKLVIGGDVLFLPSLNFLFLLGLVQYHRKNDSFEYTGP